MNRTRHAQCAPAVRLALVLTTALAMLGCGSDAPTVPASEIPGIYQATSITFTTDSTTEDLTTEGASIDLRLVPGGSASGTALVPLSVGFVTQEDLAGTWAYADGVVTLHLDREVLLELSLLSYQARPDGLTGTGDVNGRHVVVELTRVAGL